MSLPYTNLKLVWSNANPKPSKRKFRARLKVVYRAPSREKAA